jgi:hypothetical protein
MAIALPSRRNALPEFVAYRDEGCDVYPSWVTIPSLDKVAAEASR